MWRGRPVEVEPGRRCLELSAGWWAHVRPHAGGCPFEERILSSDDALVLLAAGEVVTPAGDRR